MVAAIVFLPLLGAILAGLFNKRLGDIGAQIVTCLPVLAAAALSLIVFFSWESSQAVEVFSPGGNGYANVNTQAQIIELFQWIQSGSLQVSWALRLDQLTAVMLVVVTVVSSMVHIYSVGYMHHDKSVPRFMAYLSLFTFCMLMLVTANNFLQLFFGWEGVGLSSYLLIGFWFDRESANAAAIKAFVVNRVGDFGFALGILGVFVVFGSLDFDTVLSFSSVSSKAGTTIEFLGMQLDTMTTLCLLLFIGAMGKSAQIGLHTWLPDAMEGPTPVSALIHAATMVTAGVFMVCRLSPMFEFAPFAKDVVTIVGAVTALFAATIGLTQTDIKRVIAYSTCSQLGYMFFAAGVGAYGAAMFHLFTHAFFKALLFLGAGSVIHAVSGEQDMRKMGGLWRLIPITYTLMWIGNLALAGIGIPGVYGFAGFYSKDTILEAAYAAESGVGAFAFWIGVSAALMTAFYSWRLLFMTFHGKPRADKEVMDHVHESPPSMLIPLFVLAAGALLTGVFFAPDFVGEATDEFWGTAITIVGNNVLHDAHEVPVWVKLAPLVVSIVGIALAYLMYIVRPGLPGALAGALRGIYQFLLNKWYFDQLYDALFVFPARILGRILWKSGDGAVIDGLGPDGVAAAARRIAGRVSLLQTGYVYHYAFAMLIGVVALITWYWVSGHSWPFGG